MRWILGHPQITQIKEGEVAGTPFTGRIPIWLQLPPAPPPAFVVFEICVSVESIKSGVAVTAIEAIPEFGWGHVGMFLENGVEGRLRVKPHVYGNTQKR